MEQMLIIAAEDEHRRAVACVKERAKGLEIVSELNKKAKNRRYYLYQLVEEKALKTCKKVLIVEDDDAIRDTLTYLIQTMGVTVLTATNGQEAITVLKQVKIDKEPCMILLDMMMPVMTGKEFLEAVGEDIVIASIPVVVMSAVGNNAYEGRPFLKKPFDIDMLMALVEKHCGV